MSNLRYLNNPFSAHWSRNHVELFSGRDAEGGHKIVAKCMVAMGRGGIHRLAESCAMAVRLVMSQGHCGGVLVLIL